MPEMTGEVKLKHPSLQERMNTLNSSARSDLYSILALDSVLQPWITQSNTSLSVNLNPAGHYPNILSYNSDGFRYGLGRVTLLETLEVIRAANIGVGDIVPQLEKQIPDKEIMSRIKDFCQMRLSEFEREDLVQKIQQSYSIYANKALAQMDEAEKAVDMPMYQREFRWYNKLRKEAELDAPEERKAKDNKPAMGVVASIGRAVKTMLGTK